MVLESNYRSLFSFIPKEIINVKSLACDPLPPPTAMSQYDDEFFRGTENLFAPRSRTRQDLAADQRMLERLIPDVLFREQLQVSTNLCFLYVRHSVPQAFFAAHPNFGERFPGGVVQFAQIARQLPEDELEDMMLAQVMGEQMPGQMPGQPVVFVDMMGEEDAGDHRRDDQIDNPPPRQALDIDPERRQDLEENEEDTEDEDESIAVSRSLICC